MTKQTQTSEALEPSADEAYVSPEILAAQAGEQVSFTLDLAGE